MNAAIFTVTATRPLTAIEKDARQTLAIFGDKLSATDRAAYEFNMGADPYIGEITVKQFRGETIDATAARAYTEGAEQFPGAEIFVQRAKTISAREIAQAFESGREPAGGFRIMNGREVITIQGATERRTPTGRRAGVVDTDEYTEARKNQSGGYCFDVLFVLEGGA